jgi:hypothetical protein
MPPQPSDNMRIAERPTAGHAGSEACGEVVRPGESFRLRCNPRDSPQREYYAAKTKPSPLGSLDEAGSHQGDLRCL